MAGGKLSPRQKMINMMYLVLTALLALNVSAEILEAFNQLREALRQSAEAYAHKIKDTEGAIIDAVDKEISEGVKKNEWVKGATNELSKKTAEMMKFFQEIIVQLEEYAGKDEKGELTNIKELEANYRFWMIGESGGEHDNGGRGAGKAAVLKDKLNGYAEWATKFVLDPEKKLVSDPKFKFDKICVEPAQDSTISAESENKDKTWEYFTFHGKPVIADLAMVEKFKTDVYKIHYEILQYLKAKLGAVTFKIDSLVAMDAPESRVVAAGMKFKTKIFVTAKLQGVLPEFSGGVTTDKESGGNTGTLELLAQGGFAPNTNEKKQTYAAKVLVPRADGTKQELEVKGEFIVRKPEVVITSASVQNLYQFCGNTINVDVPALGEFYNPVLTASDAEVLKSDTKTKVTIVPRGSTCILNVKSNTNGQMIDIDNVKYKVIKPPKPSIVLMVDNKEYNGASPINKKSSVVVKLNPDSDFRNALPGDARYVISSVDLLAQKSLGAPTKVGGSSGSGKDAVKGIPVETGSALKSEVPGTKIYFKIDKISRVNFQNKPVPETFGDRDLYIGAVIK
jgi:gliding motility-associated protein GldM